VDKNAWLCLGGSVEAIKEVEAKAPTKGEYLFDDCKKAGIGRFTMTGESMFSSPGSEIVNKPVTVMYASGRVAFVCDQFVGCQGGVADEIPEFHCQYALVSDMRDSHNNHVTLEQLQKEAQHDTMASIPNTCPSCGCSK
jgi:hypothetical protein